jgi:hypothetical protein
MASRPLLIKNSPESCALGFAALIVLLLVASAASAGPTTVVNDEYGFSITFPPDHELCEALSGEHLHGYRIGIDKLSCDERGPNMGLYADYDTADYDSSSDVHSDFPPGDVRSDFPPGWQSPPRGSLMSGLHFSAAKSSVVGWRYDYENDGLMEIYVKAKNERSTASSPSIIYTASLVTTKARLEVDIKAFRKMLANIKFRTVP